jgi:hypothetical protein
MSPGAKNMKTVPDALCTAENESESTNHENGTRRPWYRRNCVRERNTAENEYEQAKHENETRRSQYRRKYVQERKTLKWEGTPSVLPKTSTGAQTIKTGPDCLGTAENVSECTKYENGTRHPPYRRK